jgi:hypothetical protein
MNSKMRLIRIDRKTNGRHSFNDEVGVEYVAVEGIKLNDDIQYHKQGEFFEVNERHVDTFIAYAARENPGCAVEVYELKKVGQCPPGEYVLKEVTKDGILPV